MKRLMNTFKMLALVLFLLLPNTKVSATGAETPVQEITTYTEVKFSATAPAEHEGDIIITLINTETLKKNSVILNADNSYMASTNVLGGTVYDTKVIFDGKGEWKCDIAEQYEVPNGVSFDIAITVRDGSLSSNILTEESVENVGNEIITDAPHSEEIDKDTNLLKGEVAIQNFVDKISFIQNEEVYSDFLWADSTEFRKKEFKEHSTLNTNERWNEMSEIDKFVWNVACKVPFCYMYESTSLEDYMDKAIGSKLESLEKHDYPNADVVKEALIELCEWHYSYFLHTGTVYDYYNNTHENTNNENQSIVKEWELEENDKELDVLREELLNELSDEEKEALGIEVEAEKGTLLPVILVCVTLVIVIIIFVLYKKAKNK